MRAKETAKKALRTAQTAVPFTANGKAAAQAAVRRVLRRPHERDFLAFRHLRIDHPLVVDIGANRGQSIASFLVTCTEPRVVAFEPLPDLVRRLHARYDSPSVRIEACALGRSRGTLTLYVPVYRGYVYDGLASLDRGEAQWLNSDRVYRFRADELELREHCVDVRPLDSFDLDPEIVKIDVQGTEEAVVQGGLKTVERCRPILLVEAPSVELVALLRTLDYEPYSYRRRALVPDTLGDPNTFFITPERLELFDPAVRHATERG